MGFSLLYMTVKGFVLKRIPSIWGAGGKQSSLAKLGLLSGAELKLSRIQFPRLLELFPRKSES